MVLGKINGLDDVRDSKKMQIQASRVIADMKRAPDSMIDRDLIGSSWYVPWARQLTAFAQDNRLTFFSSPLTVENYVRFGLPYDENSPMISVPVPQNGATVNGVVPLVASGQSDFRVKTVDFAISGSHGMRMLLMARDTSYGWIAQWDTTHLPDGLYRVEGIAYDHTDHRHRARQ